MSKPYDAAAKTLLEINPQDWVDFLGIKADRVEVIDADIATVTANADKVIRVKGIDPFLINIEFVSWSDPNIATTCLDYSVLLTRKHGLFVLTFLVLLHKKANRRDITGRIEYVVNGSRYLVFEYDIIRVWETPVETFLEGKLATLALAPLADFPARRLPSVLRRIEERIESEATPKQAAELRTDAYVFAGLRFSEKKLESLMKGASKQMKNSSTYKLIFNEGREEGREEGRDEGRDEQKLITTREMLIHFAMRRLGSPEERTRVRLEAISNVPELVALIDKLESVETWEDLLAIT